MTEPRKTKIGQRRTTPPDKQINRISKRRTKERQQYVKISNELKTKANYRSELSGDKADWRGIQCHHINGRNGTDYLNPFNMIILNAVEHDLEEKHKTPERKEFLLRFIKPIRLLQGYKVEDYE